MRRISVWPAYALVAAALFVSACAGSTVQVPVATPTATVPPIPTATATPIPAPTPLNVPAGWTVLVGLHFSLAYPNGWTVQSYPSNNGSIIYVLEPANTNNQGVEVYAFQAPQTARISDLSTYCLPQSAGVSRSMLAGLPMAYLGVTGEGNNMRSWSFVNTQRTIYALDALDAQGTAAVQAQDNVSLNTFRPDNPIPWQC